MPDKRVPCMTYFAGMSQLDDADDSPGVQVLGRWCDLGTATGYIVCRSENYENVSSWLYNWVPMATIDVKPICDDNVAREIILGKKPQYEVEYNRIGSEPEDGETLFAIEYEFYKDKRVEGCKVFAGLSQQQDNDDSGGCRVLGRWHDLGTGTGFAIAAARSEGDIHSWANNWAGVCKCRIRPVLTDLTARRIIRAKPGFNHELERTMRSLKPNPRQSFWKFLCYPFLTNTPGHADRM